MVGAWVVEASEAAETEEEAPEEEASVAVGGVMAPMVAVHWAMQAMAAEATGEVALEVEAWAVVEMGWAVMAMV